MSSLSIPVALERDNVNDESVVLVRWLADHGAFVESDALLAEIETSKANIEVHSPAAGYLNHHFAAGADVPVSEPIATITSEAPASGPFLKKGANTSTAAVIAEAEYTPKKGPSAPLQMPSREPIPVTAGLAAEFTPVTAYRQRFSPLAVKMMREHGLTEKDFAGKSAVRKQDILDFLNPAAAKPVLAPAYGDAAPRAAAAASPLPTQPYEEIKLSKAKRREGMNLAAGVSNAVQSAVAVTCVTTGLQRAIAKRKIDGNSSAVMLYEVSRLLRKYPAFNSTYRDGLRLEYKQVNVGFAMDDGRGLKVAVVPNADTLSLAEITTQMRELTEAYLDDKLTTAQIANGTFTISDLSSMGISGFFPLISENQGAILGVGAEQFIPGHQYGWYELVLTFDHQLGDGRTAALFLNDLKDRMKAYESTVQELQEEMSCSRCMRSVAELREKDQHLLQSAVPNQYLCSVCLTGY
jgi:pyruvate/2-oxoglutarate dehydrogenase complex dihydrolipoamide acyltransferase (E2) component